MRHARAANAPRQPPGVHAEAGGAGAAAEPRLHLIRFHGVLAPNAKLRALVVPQGSEVQERTAEVAVAGECDVETVQSRPHRINWARLLKRVFDIDMQPCLNCGAGKLMFIAAILERPVIGKILSHLELDPQPPSPDTSGPVDCLCLARGPGAGRMRRVRPGYPEPARARISGTSGACASTPHPPMTIRSGRDARPGRGRAARGMCHLAIWPPQSPCEPGRATVRSGRSDSRHVGPGYEATPWAVGGWAGPWIRGW